KILRHVFSKPLIERSFLNLLSFIGHLNQFNSLRKNLFGNVTSKGIYRIAGSAANLATFMVNLSYVMLEKDKAKNALSTHDIKMWFLAQKQVLQVLKTCGENANGVFIQELIRKISMKTMVNAKDMVS
ncbi:MAG: hypothetical protein Q9M28_00830, partial [Mariprofundaceae bacterium]|nr:hypothetical protein [Mariprofundaceae bacterium]